MLVICSTAGIVTALDWERRSWFLLVAVLSYALALLGYLAAMVRWPGWVHYHLSSMTASYAGLWTAVLLIEWERIFGTPGVESPIP